MFVLALVAAATLLVRTIGGAEGSLGAGALIVAFLSAPFLIWNTVIKQRTLEFQKEGHLTDRISKAVEQLGAEKTVKKVVADKDGQPITRETSEPNLEVRMGGLLSLERIAQDSTAYDKGRDHVRVMEIICAYIRNNAPASMAKDFPLTAVATSLSDGFSEAELEHRRELWTLRYGNQWSDYRLRGGNLNDWLSTLPLPGVDVVLALLIIGRRSSSQKLIEAAHMVGGRGNAGSAVNMPPNSIAQDLGYRPDLRNICLQRAPLDGFCLSGLDLSCARLEGAQMASAWLEGTNLSGAILDGANLTNAELEQANAQNASLEGVMLTGANLKGAYLQGAKLECADLSYSYAQGADMTDARLDGANLNGSNLSHANLTWASISSAFLDKASLVGVTFLKTRAQATSLKGAHLKDANIWEARLDWANLSEARLEGADFDEKTRLDGAALRAIVVPALTFSPKQIDACFGDESVILSGNLLYGRLARPTHWPDLELIGGHFGNEWRRWRADPENYTVPPRPEGSD